MLAKLCLNSFWGKFGQRNNLPQNEYFTELDKFLRMVSNKTKVVQMIDLYREAKVAVQYVQEDEFVDVLPNTNVIIAAYVTAYAQLKLYSYLERLQHCVLYMDTDSVLYLSRPGNDDIQTGEFLGNMVNELKAFGADAYISEYVGLGPKNISRIGFQAATNL